MAPEQQIALWFVATILPFCINGFWGRRPDALGLSGMLIIGWCFQRVCWVIWTPPEAMQFYPVMDVAFGMTALLAWVTERAWWKLALAGTFLFQCCLHAAFWLAYPTVWANVIRYEAVLNISYAVELSLVAAPGVGDALAILARYLLSHRSGPRFHTSP